MRRTIVAAVAALLVTASSVAAHPKDSSAIAALEARVAALEARVAALEAGVTPSPSPSNIPTPTVTPTSTPAPTPTAAPTAPPAGGNIYFGAFEDQNTSNTPETFRAMLLDLRAHGLDSLMTTNGFVRHHEPLLGISDELAFPVVTSQMMGELHESWYDSPGTTIEAARSVVGPLVDALRVHPSVIGYNIRDDATMAYADKMRLVVDVVRERTTRPASPMMVEGTQGPAVFDATDPDVFITYNYPADVSNTACSWPTNWVAELRQTVSTKPAAVPLWLVLQVHSTDWGGSTALRVPTVEEVRLQTWIGLGEGARGLWWFIYSDWPPHWVGLKNSPLYPEVSALAGRVNALEGTLGTLSKVADAVTSTGYASTLRAPDGRTFAVLANTSCSARSITASRSVRDLATGTTYAAGAGISLRGGDGSLYEVLP